MPAETHSRREDLDVGRVLEFLALVIGLPDEQRDEEHDEHSVGEQSLAALGIDDDLSLLDLWDLVVEEYGERTVGEFEVPDPLPQSLADLASAFHRALSDDALTEQPEQ